MARTPDTQSKTNRLTFIPLSSEEEKISVAFKKLVIQDETTQHDMLLEAIQLLFVKHHLDLGGNPQRQLLSFEAPQPIIEKCKCGKPATLKAQDMRSHVEHKFCRECFSKVPMRYDPSYWIIIWRQES